MRKCPGTSPLGVEKIIVPSTRPDAVPGMRQVRMETTSQTLLERAYIEAFDKE